MLHRFAFCLAAAAALAPTSALGQAPEECNTCWTDACKDLSAYLPPCKPKKKHSRHSEASPDGGAPVEASPKVPLDAVTDESTAEAFLKSGKLDDALTFAAKAITEAPQWGAPLLVRGQIYVAMAGPQSELAALATPVAGVNYTVMSENLKNAVADYSAYLRVERHPKDQDQLIQQLGDLNARQALAQKNIEAATQLAAQQAEQQRQAALVAQQQEEAAKQRQAAEAERQRQLALQQAAEAEKQRQIAAQQAAEAERQRQLAAQRAAEMERQRQLALQKKAYDDSVDSAESARHAGYTLLGIGAGLGATALVLNSVGNYRYQELSTQTYATGSQIQQVKNAGDAFRTAAAISGSVGGILAIIGLPIVLSNLPPPEQHFTLAIGRGSAAVVATGVLP